MTDHTNLTTPCRIYGGSRTRAGYGLLPRELRGEANKPVYVHRWTWEQVHGPIPEGDVIMHRCDQPGCFNIDHLRLGTHAENHADAVSKGRKTWPVIPRQLKSHCNHGHGYTPENTYWNNGKRYCRACHRRDQVRYQQVKRNMTTEQAQ